MSLDPYEGIDLAFNFLTRHRPSWLDLPDFETHRDVRAVMAAVLGDATDLATSDRTVRSLCRIAVIEPGAITVLLHALTPRMLHLVRNAATAQFRVDAFGDLSLVIYEMIESGEHELLDRLAWRFVNRAHSRASQRGESEAVDRSRELLPTPHVQDWVGSALQETPRASFDPVADEAVARVDLGLFAVAVRDAVSEGRLKESTWSVYRDVRLRRSLVVSETPLTRAQRVLAFRAAAQVKAVANGSLEGHAA